MEVGAEIDSDPAEECQRNGWGRVILAVSTRPVNPRQRGILRDVITAAAPGMCTDALPSILEDSDNLEPLQNLHSHHGAAWRRRFASWRISSP